MWTLLQSSSSSALAHCHWLIHCWQSMSIIQWLKKKEKKKKRLLKSTDCYLLLMFVFLGIFSRHFVNICLYICKYIFNFSLCKEVKDNHLNVVLWDDRTDTVGDAKSSMCTLPATAPPFRPPAANVHTMWNTEPNQHPGSIHSEHWHFSSLSWTTKTWQRFLGWNNILLFFSSPLYNSYKNKN